MSLKIFICGDVVNSDGNRDFIDNNLKEIIKSCDFSICNFEAPIATENAVPIKKVGPHLKQSSDVPTYLKESGFNIASIANNHIYDYGQESLKNTIEILNQNNIESIGAGLDFESAYKPLILEKDEEKIAIISACENEFGCLYEKRDGGGYAWIFSEKIEDTIRLLRSNVDFIILIAHAGIEEISLPLKEWRNKYKRFCDIGVDVVVGHHPHVPQGYEEYHDSLIFYSLGNFYMDDKSYSNNNDSYSIVLNLEKKNKISTDIVYHKKVDGVVVLSDKKEVEFNLDLLNEMLNSDYQQEIDKICVELLNKYYLDYYKVAVGYKSLKDLFLQFAKNLVKKIIFRRNKESTKNLLLLHNIRIESHRFLVQSALSILSEKQP